MGVERKRDGFGTARFIKAGFGQDGVDGPEEVVPEASHPLPSALVDLDEIVHVHVGVA